MRAASAAFYCCKGGGGRWARALRSQRGAAARSARAPRWGGQEQERARAQPSPAQPREGGGARRERAGAACRERARPALLLLLLRRGAGCGVLACVWPVPAPLGPWAASGVLQHWPCRPPPPHRAPGLQHPRTFGLAAVSPTGAGAGDRAWSRYRHCCSPLSVGAAAAE